MKIEDIIFEEIGKGIYRLEHVKLYPTLNVFGLTKINGTFYRKVYLPDPALNRAPDVNAMEVIKLQCAYAVKIKEGEEYEKKPPFD